MKSKGSKPKQKRCPWCRRPVGEERPGNDTIYYCPNCRQQFDNDSDEGGTHYNDPSKRIERMDDQQAKHRKKVTYGHQN